MTVKWLRPKKLLAALAVISAVTVGAVVAVADPALAATGCSWCDGKDPANFQIQSGPYDYYYCSDDAYTPMEADDGVSVWIDLRYSPRCRTVWARSSSPSVHFWVERNSPHRVEDVTSSWMGGTFWTAMVYDGGYISRVCFDTHTTPICSGWW
jgi:hypothetical protein